MALQHPQEVRRCQEGVADAQAREGFVERDLALRQADDRLEMDLQPLAERGEDLGFRPRRRGGLRHEGAARRRRGLARQDRIGLRDPLGHRLGPGLHRRGLRGRGGGRPGWRGLGRLRGDGRGGRRHRGVGRSLRVGRRRGVHRRLRCRGQGRHRHRRRRHRRRSRRDGGELRSLGYLRGMGDGRGLDRRRREGRRRRRGRGGGRGDSGLQADQVLVLGRHRHRELAHDAAEKADLGRDLGQAVLQIGDRRGGRAPLLDGEEAARQQVDLARHPLDLRGQASGPSVGERGRDAAEGGGHQGRPGHRAEEGRRQECDRKADRARQEAGEAEGDPTRRRPIGAPADHEGHGDSS